MDTQTASTPADVATIFLALELSRSSWRVAIHTPVADKVSRHELAAGDIDALLALIARLRAAVEQRVASGFSRATRPGMTGSGCSGGSPRPA